MKKTSNLPSAAPADMARLLAAIANNLPLADHICRNYPIPAGRLALLTDILGCLDTENKAELTARIYRYGSMIRERDLPARQLFLWLLALAEENQDFPEP